MKEVYQNLFVGDEKDYEGRALEMRTWFVVHACKEPYHRRALGYTTQGAPKGPNYLFVYNNQNHLILNIVDGVPMNFYSDIMMDEAINYSVRGLQTNRKVFIHCNLGESRAPSIAMLVLKKIGALPDSFAQALQIFKTKYPPFNPSKGILQYVESRWTK